MRILFSMRHLGFLRNFEALLRRLALDGHEVHVTAEGSGKLGEERLIEKLSRECPAITFERVRRRDPARNAWAALGLWVRSSLDYLAYLHPRYASAPKLRDRAREQAPSLVRWLPRLPLVRSEPARGLLVRILRPLERALTPDPAVLRLIAARKPDLVVVTPLLWFHSSQVDYVRCAMRLGTRTMLCVGSWDHLTTKGLIHEVPDRVAVWNEVQRAEAAELHRVPSERVLVTGAHTYDHWFEMRPGTTREEFCHRAGLAPDRPFLLYACSSGFIAPAEVAFIREWIRSIRSSSHARLREAGLLIRPHPQNLAQWKKADFSELEGVSVWPREGANPIDAQSRAEYYDSMHHSAAVVGLNTSALIESGIIGRPVHTVLAREFAETQEGTLHFHHLLHVNGGLLRVGRTMEEHLAQLEESLAASGAVDEKSQAFVHAFVRPRGADVPAAPILAREIAELARAERPRPGGMPLAHRLLRMLLWGPAIAARVWFWLKYLRRVGRSRKVRQAQVAIVQKPVRRTLGRLLRRALRVRPIRSFMKRRVMPYFPPGADSVLPAAPKSDRELRSHLPGAGELKAATRVIFGLQRSKKPIVIGPWLGDVGQELLYWIPFLHWVKKTGELDEDRLIAVSRGGAEPWYRSLAARRIDILDLFTPGELTLPGLDEQVLERSKAFLGLADVERLHPSVLHDLLRPFREGRASSRLVETTSTHRPLPFLEIGEPEGSLPAGYVAVKLSHGEQFPNTPENRALVAAVLRNLTDRGHVAWLGGEDEIHRNGGAGLARERIHVVDPGADPRRSLEIEGRVISRARAFVGTLGGSSYLAPLYRVDSVVFHSGGDRLQCQDVEMAQRVFSTLDCGSYVALDTRHLDLLQVGLLNGKAARLEAAAIREVKVDD
ncbi:MAG TPA: hypothetical protein VMT52_19460 [Planctomycetota bacterium]|nr:hypothetical protein [Planctomycetota bacterium]